MNHYIELMHWFRKCDPDSAIGEVLHESAVEIERLKIQARELSELKAKINSEETTTSVAREFWRRIHHMKDQVPKEPSEIPMEFRVHMNTALSTLR